MEGGGRAWEWRREEDGTPPPRDLLLRGDVLGSKRVRGGGGAGDAGVWRESVLGTRLLARAAVSVPLEEEEAVGVGGVGVLESRGRLARTLRAASFLTGMRFAEGARASLAGDADLTAGVEGAEAEGVVVVVAGVGAVAGMDCDVSAFSITGYNSEKARGSAGGEVMLPCRWPA